MVGDDEIKLYFFKHPTEQYFLLESEEQEEMTSGNTYTKNYYNAFSLEDGSRKWENPLSLSGHIGKVEFYKDGFIIIPKGGNLNYFTLNNTSGAIVEGFGMAYEEMGNQATNFATQSVQQAFARFKATSEGRDFIIIFGKIEKDNALLKVNKNTGKVDGALI